jgi:hypothetical protein
MSNVQVNDKDFIRTNIINNVDIRILNLNLGESVDVSVVLKDSNNFIDVKNFHITGQEYDDWGQSDQYIEDLVLTKLGLVRKTIEPDTSLPIIYPDPSIIMP